MLLIGWGRLPLFRRARSGSFPIIRFRLTKSIHSDSSVFRISEEVRNAVNEKRPVVALETTIYTHGFPYPENINLSTRLEALVRHNGGVPAHCAILDGVARVGLSSSDMERLVKGGNARKVSRRDLGYVVGMENPKLNGGTTIAGTMILAHMAGIKVFATGGLGGVHRGVEKTMDISADLTEFARTPVAVISAGCKGFLDIPRTLEYLETQGAPVATFADGRHGEVKFPAFWSRESECTSPLTLTDEREASAMIYAQSRLGLTSGLFFANPVPEVNAISPAEMSLIITEALRLADAANVIGSANTPFVLNAIKDLSKGSSITANEALIEANIIRGTIVAVELSRLERGLPPGENLDGRIAPSAYLPKINEGHAQGSSSRDARPAHPAKDETSSEIDLLVVGSVAVDYSCDFNPLSDVAKSTADISPKLYTSNPATISQTIGGVGHNIAKAAHMLGGSVKLCSVLGSDWPGHTVRETLAKQGMDDTALVHLPRRTAQYVAVNDASKNLVYGMADMSIFEQLPPEIEDVIISMVRQSHASWLAIDSNWSAPMLQKILETAKARGIRTAYEPVSIAKSERLFASMRTDQPVVFPSPLVNLATPNVHELSAMFTTATERGLFERQDWWQVVDAMGIPSSGARVELAMATSSDLVDRGIPQRSLQLLPFIPIILTKLGPEGILLTQLLSVDDQRLSSAASAPYILSRTRTEGEGVGGVYMRLFPPNEILKHNEVVSVNGAGDTLLGVLLAALTKRSELDIEDTIALAQKAAVLSLKSEGSVSTDVANLRLALEIL